MDRNIDEWALQCASVALKLREARDKSRGVHLTAGETKILIDMLQVLKSGPK